MANSTINATLKLLLTHHLLPTFATLRLSQFDYAVIDRYVEAKQLRERGDS